LSFSEWPCVFPFPEGQLCLGLLYQSVRVAPRSGLGSAPPSPGSSPPPICCLLLFADTRAHVSKCASLPSQPPPQGSHQQTSQHPQAPPACPGALPGLRMPGCQPASVSRSPEFLVELQEGTCFSFCPSFCPSSGTLHSRLGLDPAAMFPGEGRGHGLESSLAPRERGALSRCQLSVTASSSIWFWP
jgi:hypothetical protein